MAKLVTFFVGLNDKDTKTQIITTSDAKQLICKAMVKYFDFGGTLSECSGIYKHCDGSNTIVVEASFKIEILFTETGFENSCKRFAAVLKRVLNQESILQTVSTVEASFI